MNAIAADSDDGIQMIDSTSIQAHQLAATSSRGSVTVSVAAEVGRPPKLMWSSNAQGLPIRLGLTAGETHDGQIADCILDHLEPRTLVLADNA
jgi:hypothetical protein